MCSDVDGGVVVRMMCFDADGGLRGGRCVGWVEGMPRYDHYQFKR